METKGEVNYTKGEWEQSGSIILVYGKDGGIICQMAEYRPKSNMVEFHPIPLNDPDWKLQMANAHLIAAAPLGDDLATAVLDANFDDYDDFLELQELAKEFKTKAEGRAK